MISLVVNQMFSSGCLTSCPLIVVIDVGRYQWNVVEESPDNSAKLKKVGECVIHSDVCGENGH